MENRNHSISGRVALVTGGSRGIGKAIAGELAAAGAKIVVNYQSSQKEAEAVVQSIESNGGQAIALQADVSDEAAVSRLVASAQKAFGSIDILVNNAGISRPQKPDQVTSRDWQEILQTNLTSAFLVTQAVVPAMKEKRFGRIINISSVAAHLGGVVGPHYAASKAGLQGLTHYYAAYLASYGITANSVSPALIETDMIWNNPHVKTDLIPLHRFGQPEEVASVVRLLALNGYITGQTLHVNGGWYMS